MGILFYLGLNCDEILILLDITGCTLLTWSFMTKSTFKEAKRHLTSEKLRKLIKEEQKRGNVLQRLIFINDLYEVKNVLAAARHVGVVKTIAYVWLSK